jgi:hypothetical protein
MNIVRLHSGLGQVGTHLPHRKRLLRPQPIAVVLERCCHLCHIRSDMLSQLMPRFDSLDLILFDERSHFLVNRNFL